jgi:hypothetical protein
MSPVLPSPHPSTEGKTLVLRPEIGEALASRHRSRPILNPNLPHQIRSPNLEPMNPANPIGQYIHQKVIREDELTKKKVLAFVTRQPTRNPFTHILVPNPVTAHHRRKT